jgi:hypothetical protein
LSETIRLVNDPVWTRNLGVQYTEQLSVYDGEPDMKRLCMKHLGLVLQKTDEKRFIRESLATLFEKTNFKENLEREGCAQAYGYSSTTHLDITVDILTGRINEVPAEPEKKGLFGGLFDSGPKVDQVGASGFFFFFFGFFFFFFFFFKKFFFPFCSSLVATRFSFALDMLPRMLLWS